MHIENRRQPGLLAVRRECRVPVNDQAISGPQRERDHRGERVLAERGLVLEEEATLPPRPVVREVRHRARVVCEGDQPRPLGVVSAHEAWVAVMQRANRCQVVGH